MNKKKKDKTPEIKSSTIAKKATTGAKSLHFMIAFFLGLLAFLLYSNTFKNDFVLDDSSAVQFNRFVQSGYKGIPKILSTEYRAGYWVAKGNLYRPLPLVIFAVICEQTKGQDTQPFHIVNCIAFALTAILMYLVLLKLFKNHHYLFALLITLLFVIHPIHTEVVANIKSLDELLSLLFCLAAVCMLLRYTETNNILNLILLAVFYFLALTSKEGAITFVLIFPALLYFFTDATKKQYLLSGAFFGIAAIIYLSIRANVLSHQTGLTYELQLVDNTIIAAQNLGERTASCFYNLGKYLLMCLYPHPLSIDYSYNQIPISNWSSIYAILSLLVYLIIGGLILWRWRKKEAWLFGLLFFLITISLYSNLFYIIGTNFGERLLYIPSLGICISIVFGLSKLIPSTLLQNKLTPQISPLVIGLFLILSIAGSIKTYSRNFEWKTLITLCETDVKASPKSAHLNFWYGKSLADVLQDAKYPESERQKTSDIAIDYFTRAIEIYPSFADAYGNRGKQYFNQNKLDQALADYRDAVQYKVSIWGVYSDLGLLYINLNNNDSAIYYLKKGLNIDNKQINLYRNLGVAYQRNKQYDEAINTLMQAIQIDNNQAMLFKDLGINNHIKANYPEAIKYYQEALKRIRPEELQMKKDIYSNLFSIYKKLGDEANAQKYAIPPTQ